MSTFLNKDAICRGIHHLIEGAQKKLTIIVPYIKLSDATFQCLQKANERNVEIHLVYRKELKTRDGEKLYSLQNLNLLSHFNVHAKCYINETKMIITSMNLYDYSEKYNREMGILLDRAQDQIAFNDALTESTAIIHSATLRKKSLLVEKNGFKTCVLSLENDKNDTSCELINSLFDNKEFNLMEGAYICNNYYDHIDVTIEEDFDEPVREKSGEFSIRRISLNFKWPESLLQSIYSGFRKNYNESMFNNFKIYWSYHKSPLTIYRAGKSPTKWKQLSCSETLNKFRQGIGIVAEHIQNIERSLR